MGTTRRHGFQAWSEHQNAWRSGVFYFKGGNDSMDSGMISKIQKSKRYAEEPERIAFRTFSVTFNGTHNTYNVRYDHGDWTCQCTFFRQRGVCSHTMAMERLLDPMLQEEPQEAESEPA
jgi:hypothetical protein